MNPAPRSPAAGTPHGPGCAPGTRRPSLARSHALVRPTAGPAGPRGFLHLDPGTYGALRLSSGGFSAPPDSAQPHPSNQGAPWTDQPPVAAESPARGGVCRDDPSLSPQARAPPVQRLQRTIHGRVSVARRGDVDKRTDG